MYGPDRNPDPICDATGVWIQPEEGSFAKAFRISGDRFGGIARKRDSEIVRLESSNSCERKSKELISDQRHYLLYPSAVTACKRSSWS
jgi:hypothetical protein